MRSLCLRCHLEAFGRLGLNSLRSMGSTAAYSMSRPREELVFHPAPQSYRYQQKASPRPPRPRRNRVPLLDVHVNAEKLVGTLETGLAGSVAKSGMEDVISELDRLQTGLRSKEVSLQRYNQLVKNLDHAFLTPQLRAYVRKRAETGGTIQYSEKPKQQWMHRLLREVWELEVQDDIKGDVVITKELNVSRKELFLMFSGDGRMLQAWARSCHVSLRVDIEAGVIHVTGPERNFKKLFASVSKAMGSASEKLISASSFRHFDLDLDGNAIMPVLRCFIERPDEAQPDELLVTCLGGKASAFDTAKRYMLAASRRRMALNEPIQAYNEEVHDMVTPMPIGDAELGLLDRSDQWTRLRTSISGLRLPEYVTSTTDSSPVFLSTLPNTHILKRPELKAETSFANDSSRTLKDILLGLEASDKNLVAITLGHALNQVDGQGHTFTSDIAGLFGILRCLQGLGRKSAVSQTCYKLTLIPEDGGRSDDNVNLIIDIPVLQPDLRFNPVYCASLERGVQQAIFRCPSRPTDLQAHATNNEEVSPNDAIHHFLTASIFPSRQRDGFVIRPFLDFMQRRWIFLKAEVVSALNFAVPEHQKKQNKSLEDQASIQSRINLESRWYAQDEEESLAGNAAEQDPPLRVVWSTIDGGILSGKRQELKILLDKTKSANDGDLSLSQAVCRIVNLLK